MYARYLALYATLADVRGHGPCARIYDAPRRCTYVYTRIRARVHVTASLPSCTTHDARAPLALACLARKSRVHALLRARVCSVCVCRVPQRTEGWTREKETEACTPFRFEMILTPIICLLSRSREQRRGFVRYRPRSYANKLRSAFYRAADGRASRSRGVTLFS